MHVALAVILFDCSRETNQVRMHRLVTSSPFLEDFSGVCRHNDDLKWWQSNHPSPAEDSLSLVRDRESYVGAEVCLPSQLSASLQLQCSCYRLWKWLSLTETIPWLRDYFWMYSAILTILNSLLQILPQERSYFHIDVSMQEIYFFAKSLNKNGFASITSMQIIKRKLSLWLQAFLWNPGLLRLGP